MMDDLQRVVDGTVMILHCDNCGQRLAHFAFSGEQDTDTEGLCSVSSCTNNEVVLVEAEPSEWSELERQSGQSLELRLTRQLDRHDLKFLRLIAIERDERSAAGVNFRDFRKAYKPPVMVYACACCTEGKCRAVGELTVHEFQKSGGVVTTTGRLTLSDLGSGLALPPVVTSS